ncbi:DUF3422 family protein [Pseudoduganella aquatica]|uniref:DUF3422 family protein n=1 Tax=Pseudoduganella aquatica TaxID=2660641 RepID=UPI001E42ECAB|nr:DUF3422 domain-containing protein [Pseudoduganella aquatica]
MSIVFSSLNHSLRVPLAAEIHSRPFLKLEAPELISHFAVYRAADNGSGAPVGHSHHATLGALCKHFGVSSPAGDAKYFFHDFGRFRLKWECHTEFSTYTFAGRPAQDVAGEQAFEQMPVTHLPQEWLLSLQGRLMVAAHVVLERGERLSDAQDTLQRIFEGNTLAGSQVMQGGELYTDFAIQSDGFSRFIIRDVGMRAQQAGRLVQRVLEIETYRMMALLGLPQAQQAAPALNAIESELVKLAGAMVQTDAAQADGGSVDGATEQALLGEITRLAARIEKLSLENSYRFSASKAYFRLVNARIEELREARIEGIPTVGEFMDRRLAPAMNTCEALSARQEALARRVANTNDLLRTRVGIIQEQQNRKILQSMNARAAQQLRLQQAVEGLSVAAISYYVVGLVGYSTKAAKVLGLVGNPEVVIGVMVPVVVAGVWLALRNMHKKLHTA